MKTISNYKKQLALSLASMAICASTAAATAIYGDVTVAVSTFAGVGGSGGYVDGYRTSAKFNKPYDIAADRFGNLYVADSENNATRKIEHNGTVTTFLGGGAAGTTLDAVGTYARLSQPFGVAVDSNGTVYVADTSNHRIISATPAGYATLVAGSVKGYLEGNGSTAQFSEPNSLVVDQYRNIYIADTNNTVIRKVDGGGTTSLFAGSPNVSGFADYPNSVLFSNPAGVAFDIGGNIIVADTQNNRIRKRDMLGTVTIAGDGNASYIDGIGSVATFNAPKGVAVDNLGNIYVADTGNNAIRKISYIDGNVTTVASCGISGSSDGNGSSACFNSPTRLTFDEDGELFVADSANNLIRKIVFNKPPVCQSSSLTTIAGGVLHSFVSCFDDNLTGKSLTYELLSVVGSDLTISSDGNLTYPASVPVSLEYTYRAFDGELYSADVISNINVIPSSISCNGGSAYLVDGGTYLHADFYAVDTALGTSGITFDYNITKNGSLVYAMSTQLPYMTYNFNTYSPYYDYNISYLASSVNSGSSCVGTINFPATISGGTAPFVQSIYISSSSYAKINTPISVAVSGVAPANITYGPSTFWLDYNGSGYISDFYGVFDISYDTNGTKSIKAIVTDGNDVNSSVEELNITVYDPAQIVPFSYSLAAGWNLLSLPVVAPHYLNSSDINDSFGDLSKVSAIFTYGKGEWQIWSPQGSTTYTAASKLFYLASHQGFWLKAPAASALTVFIPAMDAATSSSYLYDIGWNLIGVDGDRTISQIAAYPTYGGMKMKIIWSYDAGVWQFYTADSTLATSMAAAGYAQISTTANLRGKGLWVLLVQ